MKQIRMCITFSLFLYGVNLLAKGQNQDLPADVTDYNAPRRYTIAGIEVTGTSNYEDYLLIGFSGLSVGDEITVPGNEVTDAVKRFWKQGLFSDVKIVAAKVEGDSIWLEYRLRERPRISRLTVTGVKKGEREDIEQKLGLRTGMQVTPNMIDRAKLVIESYFDAKGFKDAEVKIVQQDSRDKEGSVDVTVAVDKKEKIKVNRICFSGNEALKASALKRAMKKTNEKFSLKNDVKTSVLKLFSSKKFTTENYANDKKLLIQKYNDEGYRDAVIVSDSVVKVSEKRVDICIAIEEGRKYYLKDVRFVGNTRYPVDVLNQILGMKKGDVYDQGKLQRRLIDDEDAVANVYFNNGYLFFQADPIEVDVSNDSISLEIRILEGEQARINQIIIRGNNQLYEDVVRRELRTKPGELFNRNLLIRSVREIAQSGHFDPETLQPRPIPDIDNGTVDIEYDLTPKGNDQMEFSVGFGQTGLIGKIGLKLANFSTRNLFSPGSYRGVIPQGEGQTLSINAQTSGKMYQSFGFSFQDSWFGGKRPNSLVFSAYYSKITGVNSRFYNSSLYPWLNTEYANDPDKYMKNISMSLGYGKRLEWPDDYFQFMATLNYQMYIMKDWQYYMNSVNNGTSHNLNLELAIQRNSVDNPVYPRSGSQFSLSLALTPPYSLWDGKDYASMAVDDPGRFRMLEYHKWKIKSKMFLPLLPLEVKRTPVFMARAEYGFLGSYNRHKKSAFENFYVGGDASSGGSYNYGVENIPMRGYASGSLGTNAYAYSKLGMELRYPVLLEPSSTIYLLGFVEGGSAWDNLKDFNPFDLKRAAGFGVRIMLPMIGLMGIDWTYGFDAINGSRQHSGSQFQFVLGQEF